MLPGHSYAVNAIMDHNIGGLEVTVSQGVVYNVSYYVRSTGRMEVGQSSIGGPVTLRFPGTIHLLSASTPVCNYLMGRLTSRG